MRYTPMLQIDLDGVLNTYIGNYDENYIPPIKVGAKDFIRRLHPDFKLVLFSSRNPQLAEKWLVENGIRDYFENVTNVKNNAYLTIDDRCVCFRGDYDSIIEKINSFKVWYK